MLFLTFLLNFPFEINLHNKKETKESNIYKYSEIYSVTVYILFLFKNNNASTSAGLSMAFFLETTSPALLKICSLGTDVGRAANTLAAKFHTRG